MKNQRPILLVEDQDDDVELTLRAFRQNRIANEVVVARDGEQALEWLHGREPDGERRHPALVLLDLKLPGLDGLEVLHRIRADEHTRLLPVVMLTSSREERDLVESYKQGANSYVQKPVDFEQFVESARQLGMYWLMLNESPPVND